MMQENATFLPFTLGAVMGMIPLGGMVVIEREARVKEDDCGPAIPKQDKAYFTGIACGMALYIPLIARYLRK